MGERITLRSGSTAFLRKDGNYLLLKRAENHGGDLHMNWARCGDFA